MIENKSSRRVSAVIIHTVFIILAILCIYPVVLVISISLSDMNSILTTGYSSLPKGANLEAYRIIFKTGGQIVTSYWVSIRVVIIGTVLSVVITAMLAYPLSRRDYKYKKPITFIVFFTMLFNGGLVPWYILIVRYLHLKDTLWVLIVPYLVLAWYVLLMKTFFQNIPKEVIEAAEIDGSSEFKTFIRIILPMSKPGIATIAFLTLLRFWNDWWLGLLFIESDELIPLQYLLQRLMSNLEEIRRQILETGIGLEQLEDFPSEPTRMAMAIIAAGPMLFVFPFFQKYFVKGINVGAVKG